MHIMGASMTAVGIVLMLLFLWWIFKDDIVDRTNEARRLRNEDEPGDDLKVCEYGSNQCESST